MTFKKRQKETTYDWARVLQDMETNNNDNLELQEAFNLFDADGDGQVKCSIQSNKQYRVS